MAKMFLAYLYVNFKVLSGLLLKRMKEKYRKQKQKIKTLKERKEGILYVSFLVAFPQSVEV